MNYDSMIEEFKIEAEEMFDSAEEGLFNIDRGQDFDQNFNSIFRSFHSLKGAAGMFGMEELQGHMHKLESLFEAQKSKGSMGKSQVDYFFKGIDSAKILLSGGSSQFVHIDLESFNSEAVANQDVAVEVGIEAVSSHSSKVETSSKNNGVVFIVDDEPELVEILEKIIGNEGYEIHTFSNGQSALDAFEKIKPDVILSDIMMPNLDGIKMLKAFDSLSSVAPVIFISGNISKEKMQEAMQFGAYAFIDKPFDNMAILNVCRNALKKSLAMKLIEKSINFMLYQFSDLDSYLKSQGKENVRVSLKNELETILEQRKILKGTKK